MEEVANPQAAVAAQRLAPWSIILMVACAVTLSIAIVLDLWPLALLAGLVGLGGVALLALTALKGGRGDAPQ